MAIHLLGLSTGTLILPPTPSYFRRMQQAHAKSHSRDRSGGSETDNAGTPTTSLHRQNDKTATELFSYAVVWWALMGLTALLGIGGGVSRRMVRTSPSIPS
jgi:glucosaminylphosphatidylinositol acyltransferase